MGNALSAGSEPTPARNLGALVFLAGAGALLIVLSLGSVSSNDIWLHLQTGEIILEEGSVPRTERFSFTAAGRPLVPHEWGAALLFALTYRAAGIAGLEILKLLLAAGAFLLLILTARGLGARAPTLAPLMALVMTLVAARLMVRPHLFSFLMVAAFLWLLDRHRRRGGRIILWLLPLQLVWANLHGGFVLGWLLAGCYGIGELRTALQERWLRRSGRLLLAVTASLPLVCLANPAGWRLLAFPFELSSNATVRSTIYEWLPPFSEPFRGSYLFREYLALTLVAAILLAWRLRGSARGLAVAGMAIAAVGLGQDGATVMPAVGLALVGAGILLGQGRAPVGPWLFALCLFLLSTRMNRAIADLALSALPVVAGALDRALRPGPVGRALRARPAVWATAAGLLLALAGLGIARYGYWYAPGSRRQSAFEVSPSPARSVAFLAEQRVTGRAFASYDAAAHLIWGLHPDVQVFIDSRNEAYGEQLLQEYQRAMTDGAALSATLDRHRIDLVLLSLRPFPPVAAVREMDAREDMVLVHFDAASSVWVRDVPRHRALIEQYGYRFLSPLFAGRGRIDASSAPAVAAEAARALAGCRNCPSAQVALAEAAFAQGEFVQAEALFRSLADDNPPSYLPNLRLGDLLALHGDAAAAAGRYRRALLARPGDPTATARLRTLQRLSGRTSRDRPLAFVNQPG